MKDEFVSTEHLLLALAKIDSKAKNVLKLNAIDEAAILKALQAVRGSSPRDRPEPRGEIPGPEEIRHRPGRTGQPRQARSGHRPRPGNSPRDPGPLAAHEEQSRADRRAGRRQDGHRRRAGLRIVAGRRAAEPEEPARHRARHGRARSPAPSFAANSKSGSRPCSAKSRPRGNVILFIDELHTVVGAGAAEGGNDAANLLKPALARGELRCIGATTLDEYRKYIEKDAALERRFQPVMVGEPNVEDTIAILRGLEAALRSASQGREDQGLGAGRRGQAFAPLHHRPLSARQGDRPDGRGHQPAGDGAGKRADRDRRGAAAADAARTGRAATGRRDRRARSATGSKRSKPR